MSRIEANRRELDRRHHLRMWASPAIYGLEQTLSEALTEHARGAVLDVGCGTMPYRDRILCSAETYEGLDVERRCDEVRYVCSATDMAPVPSHVYDTVLCSEVLEHIAEPRVALAEMCRVLRPGGTAILTVPFLGRLHEEPHDYARYTEHGLRYLCADAGLELHSLRTTGSVASFLGHQVSTALVGTTFHLPVVKWLFYGLNAGLIVAPCVWLDRFLGPIRRRMPLGYVAIASKPG